ncbi:DUF3168 domain-containing protein [Burkholderia perseverans]|uniref:DUF3168 domain-containing protein n=1 Tax=Burkholderia perseverans TaxID=2615214 RepID=UPI001FF00BFB|nr:DUF3168 domain-containing protein [Burkholderia perseverans]
MVVEAIFAALQGLVDGRVYPDAAPEGTARPFITYQGAGGRSLSTLAGPAAERNARVQLNVWDATRLGADTVMEQARTAMCDRSDSLKSLRAQPLGEPTGMHEDDTDWYGARCDFSIWFTLTPGGS